LPVLESSAPATRAAAPEGQSPAQTQPADRLPLFYARLENATAKAADNTLAIDHASVTYNWRERRWQVYSRGAIVYGRQPEALPDLLERIGSNVEAEGRVEVRLRGEGDVPRKDSGSKAQYTIDLHATSPRLYSRRHAAALTNIAGDFRIVPGSVHVREEGPGGLRHGFSANAYGGTVLMTGEFRTTRPAAYDVMVTASNVDLKALSEERKAAGHALSLSGRLTGTARLSGFMKFASVSPLETLTGAGEVEIVDGEFYHLPVLADIFQKIKPSAEGGTVGQAAGVFTIADRKVHFRRAAVSAPVLGVQGSGRVDFDGSLDFEAVAAPLADWKKQLKKSNIPLVGDIAAELAGGIQKILDTASGKLLYHFKITGTGRSPDVKPVAAPVITENAVKLFGAMIRGGERLLDAVKGDDQQK
jgi:hypothetical protein